MHKEGGKETSKLILPPEPTTQDVPVSKDDQLFKQVPIIEENPKKESFEEMIKTLKEKEGQKQEKTEWHRVILWSKLAELSGQYLSKGREVYIEGELQTRSWEKDGQKKYTTEIVGTTMQFIGSAGTGKGAGATADDLPPDLPPPPGDMGTEDDIPF